MLWLLVASVLVANTIVGRVSPWAARGLPPASATKLVSGAVFVTTALSGFVLAAVSLGFLAQISVIADAGDWSAVSLLTHDPVPTWFGVACCVLFGSAAASAFRRSVAVMRELRGTIVVGLPLASAGGQLVILDDPVPDAYAMPGLRGGQVVVTTGLWQALDTDERRVVHAHERSHLRHHHFLYACLGELALAAHPLTRPAAQTVRASIERWADEDAAAVIGDRLLVARTIARAGLATARFDSTRRPGPQLGLTHSQVAQRTHHLMELPRRSRPGRAVAIAALLGVTVVGSGVIAHETEHRFEKAHAAFLEP